MIEIVFNIVLNIIFHFFPALIVLGIVKKNKKLPVLEQISLFFILTVVLCFLNGVFINLILRIEEPGFLASGISSIIFSIPLTSYVVVTLFNKIDFKKKITKKKFDIIAYAILSFALLLLSYSLYYLYFYEFTEFDNTLYTFLSPVEGVGIEAYLHGAMFVVPMFIFLAIIVTIPIFERGKKLILEIKKKKIQILPIKFFVNHKIVYSLIILLLVFIYSMYQFLVFSYIFSLSKSTTIYDEHFVESEKVKIVFPKKKKNLIFIMVESLESTSFSETNGGFFKESVTPELEELALHNVSFSNTNLLGGFIAPRSCGWTIAGILCQTSGIPLKTSFDYVRSDSLIPKAKTLWNILDDNGYNLKVIMGSESIFGKTKAFFNDHNVKDIVDYKEIVEREGLPKNYREWWGVEDRVMFNRAKQEIFALSNSNRPFATLISTMDTHFPNGYQDKKCKTRQSDKYLNSFSCSSIIINDFVDWVKEQPFYEDTVIVIVGDHLSMQKKTFAHVNKEDRLVYNAFINTKLSPKTTKNRTFTSFDIYPTLLASLGANIEGNRLGFGTNLFSNEKTLIEKLGIEKFNEEIYIHSPFYNNFY